MKLKLVVGEQEDAPDLVVKVTQDGNELNIECNEWSLATIYVNDDDQLVMRRSTSIEDALISTDTDGRITLEDE